MLFGPIAYISFVFRCIYFLFIKVSVVVTIIIVIEQDF